MGDFIQSSAQIHHIAVIEFLTMENVQLQQIYKRMTVVYGEDMLSYPMVTRWTAEFRRGEEAFNMSPGRGTPKRSSLHRKLSCY